MKLILGSDHGGFELKEKIREWLIGEGYDLEDVGAVSLEPEDDFVDYAVGVAKKLKTSPSSRGIVLCRNGVGVDIVCNRFEGVRCVLGFDEMQVRRARRDDDVNCLSLPADYVDLEKAKSLVKVFLETGFDGSARFVRRLKKLEEVENLRTIN